MHSHPPRTSCATSAVRRRNCLSSSALARGRVRMPEPNLRRMRLGFLSMRTCYTTRKTKARKSNFRAARRQMLDSSIFDGRLYHPSPLPLASVFDRPRRLQSLTENLRNGGLASSVNAATVLLAEESLRRNSPMSQREAFPLSRIAFRPVVPRSATFSRAAAFNGASERRSVAIALISATVRGRT